MHAFQPLPDVPTVTWAWPTENGFLFRQPERFFAATRANPDYGKPGYTRDCGKRFHRGCDIAPIHRQPTGETTTVTFTDCERPFDYESDEPTWIPEDTIYAVADGVVEEACSEEAESDYGLHLVLRHDWPGREQVFYTLYGHLRDLRVGLDQPVKKGAEIGTMGQTSRIADARNWMAVSPHLHFEAWDFAKRPYNPVEFLRLGLSG